MSGTKKVLLALSDTMLSKIDKYARIDDISRTEFIRRAVFDYIKILQTKELNKQLEKGYKEMSKINLEWENLCFEADCENITAYEEKLSESE